MRKLTFEGFLKQYVAELSGVQTASVHKLADRMAENPRLKEPLFLYALAFNKVDLLLRYTVTSAVVAEYEQLSNRYSLAQMLVLLEKQSPELPEGYLKVWRSYCSVRDAALADNDTKDLIHRRVLELQQKKKLTNYRLYTDLKLNPGNVNAWLKHNDPAAGKATARGQQKAGQPDEGDRGRLVHPDNERASGSAGKPER